MILLPSFADSPVHRVLERAHERRTRSRGRRHLSPGHEYRAKLNRRIYERSIPIAADISLFCISLPAFVVFFLFSDFNDAINDEEFCNKRSGTSVTIKEYINKTIISIMELFAVFFFFSKTLNLSSLDLCAKDIVSSFHSHRKESNRDISSEQNDYKTLQLNSSNVILISVLYFWLRIVSREPWDDRHRLGRFGCAYCVPDCRSCCGFRAWWPVGRIVAKLRSSFHRKRTW